MRFPPANLQLRRAQLVLMLAALVPTILLTLLGIVLLVLHSSTTTLIAGLLVLAFSSSIITAYILASIFLSKGATLARVQNDFVSAVSHELRTPVTSIRLLLESLRDNRLETDDREQVLTLLARETQRLEQLIGKVLELSKLESGAHVYARDNVDVKQLVEETIAAFDASTLTNPTPIATDLEPGLVVVGDRPTLVRALLNLLTNAWKYTGPDKRILIEGKIVGRVVELSVHDNGPGIPLEEQDEIYEQFKRGRAAHETGAPGVGLGLAFVRTIVKGQKGKLDFVSQPGSTTFRIRLPRPRETTKHPAGQPQGATS